jgi:hypothetical protein
MSRYEVSDAGLQFLEAARDLGIVAQFVFYVGRFDQRLDVPLGAFGITKRPVNCFTYLDVLERSG